MQRSVTVFRLTEKVFRLTEKKVIFLESHLKTPQSQAYVRPKRRSEDGSPTCSSQ